MIVALLRVSTNEQDTKRQRDAIERYANDHGLPIGLWCEDKESRDLSDFRPEFQRLLALVQSGKVKVVLVEKFDRFGISGPAEWFYYRYLFQKAGCRIVSVHPGEGDLTDRDERSMLLTFFGASASEREQKSISTRVLSGKMRLAEEGVWLGGPAPFGYDKVCRSSDGRLLWRLVRVGKKSYRQLFPSGHVVERADSPGRGKGEKLKLEINEEQAAVVRLIFQLWTTERVSLMGIAVRLNRDDRRLHGKPFTGTAVKFILRNPRYLGDAIWNEKLSGRFHEVRDGKLVEIPAEEREELKRTGKKTQRLLRRSPREQWIVCRDAHDALVDRPTWELAQKKLGEVKDNKNRAPRKEEYWLRGLLYCGGCEKPLRAETHHGRVYYCCPTYHAADHQGLAEECRCGRNTIPGAEAESLVMGWVKKKNVRLAGVGEGDVAALFKAIADEHAVYDRWLEDGWPAYLGMIRECLGGQGGDFLKLLDRLLDGRKVTAQDMRQVEQAKGEALAGRTAAVTAEYEHALRSKAGAAGKREADFWAAEQERLERLLDRLEVLAVPLGERLKDAWERAMKIVGWLKEFMARVEGGTPRQKAEALRRVLARVVLRWRKERRGSRFRYFLEGADFEAADPVTSLTPPAY